MNWGEQHSFDQLPFVTVLAAAAILFLTHPDMVRLMSTVGKYRSEAVRQSSMQRAVWLTGVAAFYLWQQPHWFVTENLVVILGFITILPFVVYRVNRRAFRTWLLQPDTEQDAVENADALRRTGAVGENIVWPVMIQDTARPKKRAFRAETRSEVGKFLVDWNHAAAPATKEWEIHDSAGRLLEGEVVKGRVIYLMLATSARLKPRKSPKP